MNKLGHRNSVNVNIAIHMPNPPKTLKPTGLTIDNLQFNVDEEDAENLHSSPRAIRLDDVVEISSIARNLARNVAKRSRY